MPNLAGNVLAMLPSSLNIYAERSPASQSASMNTTKSKNSTAPANSTVLPYTTGLDGIALDLDIRLITSLWLSMVAIVLTVLGCRLWQLFNSHLRRIYAMSGEKVEQNYWTYEKSSLWPWVKQQITYAPLGKKRHNREIQLSSAVNYGTLPGRIHTALLLSYVISNIIYCSLLDYKNKDKAALMAEVRGRTGVLATANMIPLILLAGRNNPFIALLRVSFDTFNLFHRWIGRIVMAEGLTHVLAWGTNEVRAYGLRKTLDRLGSDAFFKFGTLAIIAIVIILFQSPSSVRHAFYETFLHLHQVLAVCAVLGVYVHLEVAQLPALPYIRTVVSIWIAERLFRQIRLVRLNISRRRGCTTVSVEALPGEACRVTFKLPCHVTIRPGSHVYAYLPTVSLWMSHPFSVAWTNVESEPPTGVHYHQLLGPASPSSLEKQARLLRPAFSKTPTSLSLVMVARTGMTRTLYTKAMLAKDRIIHMPGFVEGPYAGHDDLSSYGTVVLFAGGAGITHHLIQIRHLIAAAQARTVATRAIVLAWSVRDVEALAWVRPWMDEILHMEGRRDVLKMYLYVTKPRGVRDLQSPSKLVKLVTGRCDPGAILDEEIPYRIGAMAVSVCGPGAFADEVRDAVRKRLHLGYIDMNEESFTW